MKQNLLLILLILLFTASCRKEQSLVQTPLLDSDKPKLLWRERLNPNGSTLSLDPHYFDGRVVFSCESCADTPLKIFDAENGKILMVWNDWIYPAISLRYTEYSFGFGPYLITSNVRLWHSTNIVTGQRAFAFEKTGPSYNCRTYTDGFYAYWTEDYDFIDARRNRRSCIFRTPLDHLAVDTIFRFETQEGFSPSLMGLAFGKLPNGDDYVIGKNRRFDLTRPFANAERMDVFAYNITSGALIWHHDSIETTSWGGSLTCRTLGNLAFVPGHMYIHCFDVETGQKLWDYRVDKALFLGDLLVHNNTLIVKGANDELFCLDPYTGQRIWGVRNAGYGPKARLTIFNNKIFYTADGYLRVASALDGQELYSSKGEHWDQQGPLLCTPAIDPVNRRIFINNSTFAICLQMPEDW